MIFISHFLHIDPKEVKKVIRQIGSVYSAFKNAGQKSKSFEEESSDGNFDDRDKQPSVTSRQRFSGRRSHSESPKPQTAQDQVDKRKLTLFGASQIVRLPKHLNLKEQKRNRALTFKTVVNVIIKFIRQEKILRLAIGPFRLNQSTKFDFKRFKTYVKRTRAFSADLSKNKDIELKAPDAVQKRAFGMKTFAAAAGNLTKVKKLVSKKGGFIKSGSTAAINDNVEPPSDGQTPIENFQDSRHGSAYPPSYYGPPEWDHRYPPDYGPGPGAYDRHPVGRGFWGPGVDHRNWGPREDFEYSYRRDPGYDTMRSYSGRGYRDDQYTDDHYRRGIETNRSRGCRRFGFDPDERGRPFNRRDEYEENYEAAMQQYIKEYENTPHGERYKLAPPGYRNFHSGRSPDRYRNRSYSPGEDRYLRLFDSSPEDQQRGHTGREDHGYYSGPSGAQESRGSKQRKQVEGQGHKNQKNTEKQKGNRQRSQHRKRSKSDERKNRQLSPQEDGLYEEESARTPEEYRWNRDSRERGLYPTDRLINENVRGGRGFDHDYNDSYRRFPDPREEMAKMHAVAVYAEAMGGVNDDEGWSLMLSWKHKSLPHSLA